MVGYESIYLHIIYIKMRAEAMSLSEINDIHDELNSTEVWAVWDSADGRWKMIYVHLRDLREEA